ncbi:ABC transporter permease [Kribbella sandramycini]|uniref:ABC transporter permease n=1 Tax=Kribbella sandramycini TaxID=60450 RepID=A0A7Y4L0A7_9ACTN|nr:ABC transporter permease [Kribbella sandramycini]MBB6565671.1 spermidine/putrescine transport system permease protein [Kribbella sandramycini]NOL41934.1 ABC transporter permease [Kribbella sandramycini]
MSAVGQLGAASQSAAPPPVERSGRRMTAYLLLLPGGLWLLLFFVVPLVSLLAASLYDPNGSIENGFSMTWHWQNFGTTMADYWRPFGRSLWYALLTTAFCLLLGYPLAYAIAMRAGRWKNLMLALVIAPFFTSFLIRTLSWKMLLSDNGFVVDALQWLRILGPDGRLLATTAAVVTGLTYNFLPFMVLPLYASLEKIDRRLIEAGGDLFAGPVTTFRTVTLPLSMPGVVAGTLLTFIPAAGDYINAQLLGTPKQRMIGNDIQRLFAAGAYPTAAALSVTLMAAIVVLVLIYVRRSGTEELV